MTESLLTKKELGAFFRLSPPCARALCEKHGVMPLNVGTGKTCAPKISLYFSSGIRHNAFHGA